MRSRPGISTCSVAFEAAIDVQRNSRSLRKELDRLTKDIASKQLRLEDETFRSRAPEHIVKGLESTLAERRTEFEKLKERLAQLEKNFDPALKRRRTQPRATPWVRIIDVAPEGRRILRPFRAKSRTHPGRCPG